MVIVGPFGPQKRHGPLTGDDIQTHDIRIKADGSLQVRNVKNGMVKSLCGNHESSNPKGFREVPLIRAYFPLGLPGEGNPSVDLFLDAREAVTLCAMRFSGQPWAYRVIFLAGVAIAPHAPLRHTPAPESPWTLEAMAPRAAWSQHPFVGSPVRNHLSRSTRRAWYSDPFSSPVPGFERRHTIGGGSGDANATPSAPLDLNREDLSVELLVPILRQLSNQMQSKDKALRELAQRIQERRQQLGGRFTSYLDLQPIKGLGRGVTELEKLTRIDSAVRDPLLKRMPSSRDYQEFDARYKLFPVDPATLVPVVSVLGYQDFSDASFQGSLKIVRREVDDMRAAAARGQTYIRAARGTQTRGFLNRADPDEGFEEAPGVYRSLPREDALFFEHILREATSPDVFEKYVSFLRNPSARLLEDMNHSTWQDIQEFESFTSSFLSLVRFYTGAHIPNYVEEMKRLYPLLWNAPPDQGTLVPGYLLLNPRVKHPSSAHRFQVWAETDEGRSFMAALERANVPAVLDPRHGAWVRDQFTHLSADLDWILIDKTELPDGPSHLWENRQAMGLQHGGGVIPGRLRTGVLLVSNHFAEAERRVLAWKLRERTISLYSLPPGFITLIDGGRRYWVHTPHLDTVLNVIDAEFLEDGRPRLIMDPFYYESIRRHPEFTRLLEEQGLSAQEIAIIDLEDTGLNLANFTTLRDSRGTNRIIFNGVSRTVARLPLKRDRVVEIQHPIERLPIHGGLQRCLTGMMPRELLPHKSQRLDVELDPDIERDRAHVTTLLAQVQPFAAVLTSHGLQTLRIFRSDQPFTVLNYSQLPVSALLFLPAGRFSLTDFTLAMAETAVRLMSIGGVANGDSAHRTIAAMDDQFRPMRDHPLRLLSRDLAARIARRELSDEPTLAREISHGLRSHVADRPRDIGTLPVSEGIQALKDVMDYFLSRHGKTVFTDPLLRNLDQAMALLRAPGDRYEQVVKDLIDIVSPRESGWKQLFRAA